MRIAIIGAGMAGLSCATRLKQAGHSVSVFDKGRGPGGRMSTRRMEVDGQTLHFDHGAQYFTVRDSGFRAQVESWQREGHAAPWTPGGSDAWVGTPAMNAPIRAMAEELGVRFDCRIEAIERGTKGWTLLGDGVPDDRFDTLVVAVPSEQVPALVQPHDTRMARLAAETESDPCWTVMVAFEAPLESAADTVREQGAIGWAARNSSKPGRGDTECWVIQAGPEWSRSHLEEDKEAITPRLLSALKSATGGKLPPLIASSAHRWRYARSGSAGEGSLWNGEIGLGACGDWLKGPRVEAAWLSGKELAGRILDRG